MSKPNQNRTSPGTSDLPAPQRRERERSEPDRSGGAGRSDAATPGADPPPVPDPEVPATATRRQFTAEYKRSILEQADACREDGAIGALLRREGLYSSLLSKWRQQRQRGEREGLAPKKRGRKPTANPLAEENRRLQSENTRLKHKLHQAETIIDVQKKVSTLLGISLPETPAHEENS